MTSVAIAPAAFPVHDLKVSVYRIPTDGHESDGTFEWDATTLVLVEVEAGGKTGIGYTYADEATAVVIDKTLRKVIAGQDALATAALWTKMVASVRNLGRDGIAAMAISAVDVALWDLRGKICEQPVYELLGPY
ncbi:MAG: enolase C-terminal domain-like protein, partial [Vulcanimicrobiaceae bacterium]